MDIIAAARRVAYVAARDEYDEIATLEDGIAANPASFLAEAIPQVLLAIADVRTLAPEVEGMGALIGRIERCLYSAADVMAAEAGVALAELGADYWSGQWNDPWVFGPDATQH
ncbi:MAG TPA: hypothetical protein VK196_06110 [Magnetospirillum sp.]|nr:hypothetical protein [Magnetospirillum sp.]